MAWLAWIQGHNKSILEYVAAPCSLWIDPTYYPVKRQCTWENFDTISKYYPEPLNFLELPPADRYHTKKYFTSSLRNAITLYTGVLDLAC